MSWWMSPISPMSPKSQSGHNLNVPNVLMNLPNVPNVLLNVMNVPNLPILKLEYPQCKMEWCFNQCCTALYRAQYRPLIGCSVQLRISQYNWICSKLHCRWLKGWLWWSQWIFCQSQILWQKLWGGASGSGVVGGASGYGVRASGYGVGASGYGSLVIIVSAQSKELGFWVF